jgi:hypothetical protein
MMMGSLRVGVAGMGEAWTQGGPAVVKWESMSLRR